MEYNILTRAYKLTFSLRKLHKSLRANFDVLENGDIIHTQKLERIHTSSFAKIFYFKKNNNFSFQRIMSYPCRMETVL